MLKHTVKLTHKIGEKEGCFICDNDTELHDAKEMLCQFLKHLGCIEDQVKAQKQAAAEQQAAQQVQEQAPTPQE
jgi:hypothetical protein